MALIFVPVRGVLWQQNHNTTSQSLITALIKQQGGLNITTESPPQLYLFRGIPSKSKSMTSSCPSLTLGLLSSGKQGHQQIPSLSFPMHVHNLYYTASHGTVRLYSYN